jgi:hypothetical protein
MTCDGADYVCPWQNIQTVVANVDYCYLNTGPNAALIVPRRCFEDEEMFQLFVKTAVIYHWNNEKKPASPAPNPEAAASSDEHTLAPLPPLRL